MTVIHHGTPMIIQSDREQAAKCAVLTEFRALILAGKMDHYAQPWADYRNAAMLEGARLALEAVESGRSIRALSPETIIKEAGQ